MVVARVAVLLAAVVGLWLGARTMVDGAVRLARGAGLSEVVIGLTLVAVGTSAPELVVSVDAALAGASDVAVGNVVGSNVFNLALVLGLVSLLRVLPVTRALVRRDGLVLLVATFLFAGFLVDLRVTRLEGLLGVGLLVAYTGYLLRTTPEPTATADGGTDAATATDATAAVPAGVVVDRLPTGGRLRTAALTVAGLGVVLASGHLLVESAVVLARAGGLSEWVIGATVVAAGTSTPEFAVSLVALRRGSAGVSVGNVVGSNVFNVLGVVGVAAVVSPATVGGEAFGSVAWLLVVTVLAVAAMWTGRVLSRVEGGLFAGSEVVRWAVGLLG
jgi:cation:H+ antiporter